MKKISPKCFLTPIEVSLFADDILEHCLKNRMSLKTSMSLLLPKITPKFGSCASAVETLDEELKKETFFWKKAPSFELGKTPGRVSVLKSSGFYWVCRPLDLDGRRVGTLALAYNKPVEPDAEYLYCLNALCEELDNILWNIQSAAVKQKLTERVMRSLTRSVLREAIDEAVKALHAEIPFRRLGMVYRNEDATEGERIQYRIYNGKICSHDSEQNPHKGLSREIKKQGMNILDPDRHVVRGLLGLREGMGFILSGQAAGQLGKLVVDVDGGLSTFGRDMMRIFSNSVSQRLIDYNRERRHLAKFFAPETVSELLGVPDYIRKHLSPRVKPLVILYVDINSFTKLCEKGLKKPDRIGKFVDYWSEGVVNIGWKRGGVFDKMVGDCVILLFGPPFFRRSPAECALEAAMAAREIQTFTARIGKMREYRDLAKTIKAKGLGVAAGINLCGSAVGLFGPNHDFTAFSSGMNQTARLQSKASFRETFVMDSVRDAVLRAGLGKGLRFEGPFETEAKNVTKPLRYYRLKFR